MTLPEDQSDCSPKEGMKNTREKEENKKTGLISLSQLDNGQLQIISRSLSRAHAHTV